MNIKSVILLCLVMFPIASSRQAVQRSEVNQENVPDEVRACLRTRPEIEINGGINPFLISGDYDGDGITDFAVQVRTKKDQHKGILICFARDLAVLVGAGAATPWSKGHDDRWPFDSWFLARKGGKHVSIYPQIKFDALALVIADEGGGLVFWDGKEVHWQQEE
jgi:hypothetical protein